MSTMSSHLAMMLFAMLFPVAHSSSIGLPSTNLHSVTEFRNPAQTPQATSMHRRSLMRRIKHSVAKSLYTQANIHAISRSDVIFLRFQNSRSAMRIRGGSEFADVLTCDTTLGKQCQFIIFHVFVH